MNNNYPVIKSKSEEASDSYIIFKLKGKQYAIPVKDVTEIINMPQIEVIKTMSDIVMGILNYKGVIIKAIDISTLLGFTPTEITTDNKLIIISINKNCYAVNTEDIVDIISLNENNVTEIRNNNDNSIIKKIYNKENTIINIINLDNIDNIINTDNPQKSNIDYLELFPKDEKSKQILQIREEEFLNKQEITNFSYKLDYNNQFVLFTLDNNNYFLDLKYVKEFTLVKRLNMTKLPYTHNFIKGIINIRGNFILAIDLKKFLNPKNTSDCGNKLIIIEGKNYNLALAVDEIKYIKSIDNTQPTIHLKETTEYISSEFVENDILYSILNIEEIIKDERLYINIE